MDEQLIDEAVASPVLRRSTFLTVLCILTWVGSAAIIGLYGYAYISLSSLVRSWGKDVSPGMRWILWNMLISCAGSVVCAGAAIAMWKLRKWGFYVYVAGQVIPIATTVYVLVITKSLKYSGVFELLLSALWVLVPIGFIVMYATNLKYMRK